MTIETAPFIDSLDGTLPTDNDFVFEGDDHIKLIKLALLATFTGITGAVTVTHTEINALAGITGVIETRLDTLEAVVVPVEVPAGSRMLFQQATAPTGWTIDATFNNGIMRIVDGSTQAFVTVASPGGSDVFTTAFSASKATESYTLLEADIPPHTHTHNEYKISGAVNMATGGSVGLANTSQITGSTGGGGGHTHDITLDPTFVDIIIAVKDA